MHPSFRKRPFYADYLNAQVQETLGALRLILCGLLAEYLEYVRTYSMIERAKFDKWSSRVDIHNQTRRTTTRTTEIKQEQTVTKADSMIS